MVGNTLTSAVQKQDFVARWGSDEFVVMALGTETASLREIANRMLLLVENSWISLDDGRVVSLTVSIGGAMAEWFDTSESMMDKADESLYLGKTLGRIRCIFYQ